MFLPFTSKKTAFFKWATNHQLHICRMLQEDGLRANYALIKLLHHGGKLVAYWQSTLFMVIQVSRRRQILCNRYILSTSILDHLFHTKLFLIVLFSDESL